MEKPKLIVTDLDNTLLRSDKNISARNISVLQQCQAQGILIAFATARSKPAASRMLAQFMPDLLIVYGGALAVAGNQVIQRFDIRADISSSLINECLRTPEISSVLAINESVALTNNIRELEAADYSHYRYSDFSDNADISYLKISVVASDHRTVEKIASHYPMCDLLRYTGEDLYRFANRDAVKWNAVKAVAAHYGFRSEEIVAFGDDVNDTDMIKNCGTGVAMQNAVESVKAVANCTCGSNNDDGVAEWLEQHIL